MGIGDEIMAAGRAAALSSENGDHPVAIVDKQGSPRKHPLWEGNPSIDMNSTLTMRDHPGHRGYIRRWDIGPRVVFEPTYCNRDHPGRLYVPAWARQWARKNVPKGCVIIETVVRRPSSMGKDWGIQRWRTVADRLSAFKLIQLGADDERPMVAPWIRTSTVWHAAAAIERAALVLTVEGGTHHMAGALDVPAVTIFGGFIHPDTTGYETTIALYVDGPDSPCGRFDACSHCDEALASITVDDVVNAASSFLEQRTVHVREVRYESHQAI